MPSVHEEVIFESIERHNMAQLELLLQQGADPNIVEDGFLKRSPLHVAVVALDDGGTLEAIRLLLAYGADIDRATEGLGGGTPLLCALFNDETEAVRYLLDAGADPNAIGGEGDSPLRWSVGKGDHATAALLISKGASRSIDSYGSIDGTTALGIATRQLDIAMVRLLLAAGADPDARDLDRQTAEDRLPPPTRDNMHSRDAILALLTREKKSGA